MGMYTDLIRSIPLIILQLNSRPVLRQDYTVFIAQIRHKSGIAGGPLMIKIEQTGNDSAPEKVVKRLLDNIEAGEMKPGDKLPTQEQLGEIFGVGRSSVREATNALAIMGYLEIVQGKGTFIKKQLPTDGRNESSLHRTFQDGNLFNLMELREMLECHVVRKAAERAEDDHLAFLRKTITNIENCGDEVQKFITEDLKFHVAICEAAKNPEIGEIIKIIHTTVNNRLPVAFSVSRREKIIKAIETLRKIYQHIVSGEGEKAARYMRNHLETLNETLRNSVNQPVKETNG